MAAVTPLSSRTYHCRPRRHTDNLSSVKTRRAIFRCLQQPHTLQTLTQKLTQKLTRSITPSHEVLVLVANTTGLGERRGAKMGAMGRVPVENIIGDVLAAPNQDAFAAGCDACFLVIHPDMKTGDANLWTHWVRGMSLTGEGSVRLWGGKGARALQRAAALCRVYLSRAAAIPAPRHVRTSTCYCAVLPS